jgi:hypothetical protein
MTRRSLVRLLGAAVTGLVAGSRTHAEEIAGLPSPAPPPRHVCQGLNACKGQGSCKHGCSGHGCEGKNDCRGKGGCAAPAAQHACAGKNSCKGIGGCASGNKGCAAKNTCKAKGGCEVPLRVDHFTRRKKAAQGHPSS